MIVLLDGRLGFLFIVDTWLIGGTGLSVNGPPLRRAFLVFVNEFAI